MSSILSISLITLTLVSLKRQLIHEKTVSRDRWLDCYDFIVVGSGSAGAVVAHRLAESGVHMVALLEAGGAQNAIWTDIPGLFHNNTSKGLHEWHYYNVPQVNASLAYKNGMSTDFKGKVLGGSSTVNGMNHLRGSRFDFDNMANTYGAVGWSYSDVLPLFIKSENNSDAKLVRENPGYHGTGGPVGVSSQTHSEPILLLMRQQFNRLGFETIDFNGASQLGTGFIQFSIKDGLRSSTANAYIDPNPFPHNLHILTQSLVTRVLFNRTNSGLIASAVEFVRDGKYHRIRADKEIIVSAGPINSPQLLMLSGIGPKEHLNSLGIRVLTDLPVGDNYANHITVYITTAINTQGLYTFSQALNVNQLSALYYNHSGPLSVFVPTLYTFLSSTGNKFKDWPNLNIAVTGAKANAPGFNFANEYANQTAFNVYHAFTADKDILTFLVTLVRPKSKGIIRLASRDPFEYPLIDPKFLTHSQDMEDLVEAIKYTFLILTVTPFAQYVTLPPIPVPGCHLCPDQPIYECDSYIRCFIRQLSESLYHPVGSCRMGAQHRPDVVVDPRCRVKHVSRLRVADSSIYSEPINANTNAAAILAGEKCSQIIIEDWEEWDRKAQG